MESEAPALVAPLPADFMMLVDVPVLKRAEVMLRAIMHSASAALRDRAAIHQFYFGTAEASEGGKSGADMPHSHYTYDNLHGMGVMRVSLGSGTRQLAAAYVCDFGAGRFSALTENRPPIFRFYIDYDMLFANFPGAAEESLYKFMERIEKRELAKFYPGVPDTSPLFTSTVASSGIISTIAGFKVGMHVYYPRLYVNTEQALYITTAIINALVHERVPPVGLTWEKIVDQAVYGEGRGLRWVWHFKAGPCPICCSSGTSAADKSRKRKAGHAGHSAYCETCNNSGRVADTSTSMYAPLYRVDGTCARTLVMPTCRNTPSVDLMLECSLRAFYAPEPTEGFVTYAGAAPIPKFITAKRGGTRVQFSDEAAAHRSAAAGTTHHAPESATIEDIPCDSDRGRVLLAAIRRQDEHWRKLDLSRISKHRVRTERAYYKVNVRGEGSGHCLNLQGDHRSARIYFLVRASGITQRCFCKCADARAGSGGACHAYESKPFELARTEATVLFEAATFSFELFNSPGGLNALTEPSTGPYARPPGHEAVGETLNPQRALAHAVLTSYAVAGAKPNTSESALTPETSAGLYFSQVLSHKFNTRAGDPRAKTHTSATIATPTREHDETEQ